MLPLTALYRDFGPEESDRIPFATPTAVPTPSLSADVRVSLTETGLVPRTARVAMVDVAALSSDRAGFVTVYPCDKPRPTASNLNYVGFDTKVATAMVPIAADGTVCVYTFADAALWVGALGYYSA